MSATTCPARLSCSTFAHPTRVTRRLRCWASIPAIATAIAAHQRLAVAGDLRSPDTRDVKIAAHQRLAVAGDLRSPDTRDVTVNPIAQVRAGRRTRDVGRDQLGPRRSDVRGDRVPARRRRSARGAGSRQEPRDDEACVTHEVAPVAKGEAATGRGAPAKGPLGLCGCPVPRAAPRPPEPLPAGQARDQPIGELHRSNTPQVVPCTCEPRACRGSGSGAPGRRRRSGRCP